jgi:hypothetical protein
MNPSQATLSLALSLTLALPLAAQQTGLGPLPFYSHVGPGADFAEFGTTTRTAGVVTPTQSNPFFLTGIGIPSGAVLVDSFVWWARMFDGPTSPASDAVAINGTGVMGTLVGEGAPDLCWGKDRVACYMASGIVPPLSLTGIGNSFAGFTDKSFGGDPGAYGEGMTIILVYEVPGNPTSTVDLWRGYTSTTSSGLGVASATLSMTSAFPGGVAHLALNALDGQSTPDDLFLNGTLASGVVPGTNVPGNCWTGLRGPLSTNNLFDTAEGDVASFMSMGATSLAIASTTSGDCIGHGLAALAYGGGVACTGSTFYCTAKTSTAGCVAIIETIGPAGLNMGCPMSGADDFRVAVRLADSMRSGLIFYGLSGPASAPFHGRTLCVAPPQIRTPGMSTGGTGTCFGSLAVTVNDPATPLNQPPGTSMWLQGWWRDPADPFGDALSPAVMITFD